MNNTLYTCINKYFVNFSKMEIDTKLKFSRSIQKYITYICNLKLYNLYMFKDVNIFGFCQFSQRL